MFKENGGQISGSIYSIYWCVSGVISVIYETINQGGKMKPQDVYRFEQVLRLSISQDLLSKQSNFHSKEDMEEARKIVEKKH
jgi:hypothetical protein